MRQKGWLNRTMQHTPRLCIDGRAAKDFMAKGLVAQEVIDQLVSAQGENGISSEWIEKHRTVLLSHPNQVFSGQLKRFDTRKKIGATPIDWIWNKQFVKKAHISLLHRFVPVDRAKGTLPLPVINTLLPANDKLPFFLSKNENQIYVVPSSLDAMILEKKYQIAPEQITLVQSAVRRYVHFVDRMKPAFEGFILILVGDSKDAEMVPKLREVLTKRFPSIQQKVMVLKNNTNVAAVNWMKLLQNTRLCVYLNSQPFDWATLALETFYWDIPTVFSDKNNTLSELLPHSVLTLSQFLVNQPGFEELKTQSQKARDTLFDRGVFDAFSLARQYRKIYSEFSITPSKEVKNTTV